MIEIECTCTHRGCKCILLVLCDYITRVVALEIAGETIRVYTALGSNWLDVSW